VVIKDVSFEKIRIPLKKTFRIAFGEYDEVENVLVKIVTDNGIVGYGEAAPFSPVTGETVDGVISVLRIFRSGLIGMDPMDIDGAHAMMDKLFAHNGAAKCGIDIALYDILGKHMQMPLYRVLGGGCGQVHGDITVGINPPEIMVEEAKQRYSEGFDIIKVKIGIDPDQDVRVLTMIRQALGDGLRLRVDANQGYTPGTAVDVIHKLRAIGVESIEQCLPEWNMEGMAFIRSQACGMKIMLDESVHNVHDAFKAGKLQAADQINIKLMKCGGLFPALKINSVAEAAGMECMVGCMLESRLAIAAGLALVASQKNVTEADCDSFLYFKEPGAGIFGGFTNTGGQFKLSDKPGLGIELNI